MPSLPQPTHRKFYLCQKKDKANHLKTKDWYTRDTGLIMALPAAAQHVRLLGLNMIRMDCCLPGQYWCLNTGQLDVSKLVKDIQIIYSEEEMWKTSIWVVTSRDHICHKVVMILDNIQWEQQESCSRGFDKEWGRREEGGGRDDTEASDLQAGKKKDVRRKYVGK